MRFGILGPLEARDGERLIQLGQPRQRAVLALLLVSPNQIVSLDRLIDVLWNGQSPAKATAALQVHISWLRAALEPLRPAGMRNNYLVTKAPGYLLRVAPGHLDSARFEDLVAEGRTLLAAGDVGPARSVLAEALALWRGPALAEFGAYDFARAEAGRLEELRAGARADRIECDLALGGHAGVIAETEGLVEQRPLQERLWSLLTLAYYRSGRQGDALRALTRARGALREELGVEPGPALRQLEEDVFQQSRSLDWEQPDDGAHPRHAEPRDRTLLPPSEDPVFETSPVRPRVLVGRDAELRLLMAALAGAHAGKGGVVLVSGEPGIGKTRLVEELVSRAAAMGAVVAWGRCYEGEGAPSFWPWVQVVRGLLLGGDRDSVRAAVKPEAGEIAQIWPEVKELVPELEPPPAVDPAAARFRLYQAVNRLLATLMAPRPMVVVLDDLHWADVPSLRLVEFVGSHVAETGLLLVATFRDVDPTMGSELAKTLGALARQPDLVRVALEGLSRAECATFITETFGLRPTEQATAVVHARTDGNPFFVGELARLLASEGWLEGGLGGDLVPSADVPPGVRDVMRRRLGRLPERTNDLLALAAVLGREVDVAVVATAGRTEEHEVVDLLDAAVAVGILLEDEAVVGRYRFSHALVQETVLHEIGLNQQAKLHARAAVALRVVYGADRDRAAEIANHRYLGMPVVPPEEAYEALLDAAAVAERRLAYEQAELQLRRAVEVTARMRAGAERDQRELEIQHRLATLLSVTQGYQSAAVEQAWKRAHELCRTLANSPVVFASLWGLARLSRTRCQFDLSVKFGAELLELSKTAASAAFAAAGHDVLGLAAFFTGDLASADQHLSELLELSEEPFSEAEAAALVLDPHVVARGYLANVRWTRGEEEDALHLSAESRRLATQRGHRLSQAVALLYGAKLQTLRDRPAEARDVAAEVFRLAEKGPLGPLEAVTDVIDGWARARLGEPAEGTAIIAKALVTLRAADWRLAFTYFRGLQADALRAGGDLPAALAAAQAGLDEANATNEHYYEAELCRLAGEITFAARRGPGGAADAQAWLRRAVATAERQGALQFRRRAEQSLARLASG